jgi:hypothetical protein
MIKIIMAILCFVQTSNVFALEPMEENELQQVLGQGGVYLSGDITINESGGPLNDATDTSTPSVWQKNCTGSATDKRCGARIAVNAGEGTNSGWLVLDNIRGRFSFEGMTLKTRTVNEGFEGDGVLFNSNVLEIGLPNEVSYGGVSYTLANSSKARPTDVGFTQTDILNVNIDGNVSLRGNALFFPTGTP